ALQCPCSAARYPVHSFPAAIRPSDDKSRRRVLLIHGRVFRGSGPPGSLPVLFRRARQPAHRRALQSNAPTCRRTSCSPPLNGRGQTPSFTTASSLVQPSTGTFPVSTVGSMVWGTVIAREI